MSARLARLVLALYPLAYRRRYGAEMEALVEDQGASPRSILDLARGAAAAHLRPEPGLARELGTDDRLKLGLSSTLLAWVVFALLGLALYKTTEVHPFTGGEGRGLPWAAHLAIQVMALVASAAVVIGATPLALAALRQAREQPAVRRAIALVLGCVAVFGAATAALVIFAHTGSVPGAGLDLAILTAWTALALACGIGCALAARTGLFATEVPRGVLRLGRACASVVVLCMIGIAVATAVCLLALAPDAPGLAGEANGPLGLLGVGASLALQLALMVAVCVPAVASAVRGYRLR